MAEGGAVGRQPGSHGGRCVRGIAVERHDQAGVDHVAPSTILKVNMTFYPAWDAEKYVMYNLEIAVI